MTYKFRKNKKDLNTKRTLPQEDLTVPSGAALPLNSSASPHEQSLHAFRLPVVAQTAVLDSFNLHEIHEINTCFVVIYDTLTS